MISKLLPLAIMLVLIISCGLNDNTSQVEFFERSEKHYSKFVNQNSAPAGGIIPDLTHDIYVINDDEYEIEVALYKDKRFFYNLDSKKYIGYGNWRYENGRLILEAVTRHFKMFIELVSLDPEGDDLALAYTDRFGYKVKSLEISNLVKHVHSFD
jgi:hypothetical protein